MPQKEFIFMFHLKTKKKQKSLGAMWDDKEKNGLLQKP